MDWGSNISSLNAPGADCLCRHTQLHHAFVAHCCYRLSSWLALGEDATEDQIIAVLWDLRIVIAANDPNALGY